MSRSRHHGCGRGCGVCSLDACALLKVRDARAPTVDEYEPDVATCPSCYSARASIDDRCECGDFDRDDERADPLLARLRFACDADGRYILLGTPNEAKPDRVLRAALIASWSVPNGTDSVELLRECRDNK